MPYTSKTRSLRLSGDRRRSWDCTSSTATFRKESHERGRADGRIRTDKHLGHRVLASKRWRGRLTASGQTPQLESASLAGPSGVSPAGHIAMDKGMLGDRKGTVIDSPAPESAHDDRHGPRERMRAQENETGDGEAVLVRVYGFTGIWSQAKTNKGPPYLHRRKEARSDAAMANVPPQAIGRPGAEGND